ncbi:peptidase associated/transthyretin-like domain-containing protein [Mucilaginibacter pedocola]|uniref:Carboxypeptidase-like regulatory domain-containing protein n=1 Tax=Mucilaginibacter pedocola TaxID=1792845 RepID=A0A1S9PKK9_9SPHI|nr:hypothetical protein [Mucilaginibacter pedocola]OOQ61481.1 hypothetical protein BC343_20225 [Mucilaginibacter pedocola]
MKLWTFLLLCATQLTAFAQQKEVTGIVFDKDNNTRIAKVNVLNSTTGKSVYNTFKGEFIIAANIGDVLIFSKQEFHSDTLKVKDLAALAVYLKPKAIQLKEVTVRDSVLGPKRKYLATKTDFNRIYGSIGNRDLLSVGQGSVGFSIDALYNMFSRSGRNAEHLKQIIDRDYMQAQIDYRFNKSFVAGITFLKDPELTDFMFKYRPSYNLVTTASEYEFVKYVRTSFKRYKRNPRAFELEPLPPQYLDVK